MSTVDRISALLAKAERTDNLHEADAYLVKAQQLATAASIDLALARHRQREREREQAAGPIMRTVTIGEKAKRANPHLIALFVVVAHANDAQVDVATNSTYVVAYGLPSDLDVIDALFTSLSVQMVEQAQTWLATGEWRETTYVRVERRYGFATRTKKPHTAQTARASFYRAYAARIAERLDEARAQAVAAASATAGASTEVAASMEVALRDKAAQVRTFHRRTSDARGSWRGYSGAARSDRGQAAAAGRTAAERARLGQAPEVGPGARSIPRS